MNQSYLKSSLDGLNGSGKSGTACRLAVGISKEFCNSAPVLVSDSEERYRFYKATIFDVEKVPLIINPGKSIVDVQKAMARAEKEQVCVTINDQLTTPWMEGIREFSYSNGNMPFDRRQQLMNQWEPIVETFRYGQFHSIACGRLGFNWTKVENDQGEMELMQGDSKFNAGGGNNFGYEADLELEMRRKKNFVGTGKKLLGKFFGNRLAVQHICSVVKDAAGGVLNGQEFEFDSQSGLYKPGDYRQVLDAFRPYIEFMQRVDAPLKASQSTGDLLISGKTPWAKDQSNRTSLLEELDANLTFCFPAGEGKSKLAKMFRDLTLEELNTFISWSRMEEETLTADIERNVLVVRKMRARIEDGEMPTDQNSLKKLVDLAIQDAFHPGKHMTLIEAMGEMSISREMAKKKTNGRDTAA